MRLEYIAGIVLTLVWVGVWFSKPGTLAVSPKEAPTMIMIIWMIVAISVLFDAPMGSIKWFLLIIAASIVIGSVMFEVERLKKKLTQAKQDKEEDKDKEQEQRQINKKGKQGKKGKSRKP